MADKITPIQRSENMRRIKSKDSIPELTIRRLIHGMGYRYRLHCKDLPGKPDLVFPSRKKLIFVHGCFWHSHSSSDCPIAHYPKSNKKYWSPKLKRNKRRDQSNQQLLACQGWDVHIVWECEIKEIENLKLRLTSFLER